MLWAGNAKDEFESVEPIAQSVRPDTTAPYIIGPSIRLISYVSSENELRVSILDEDSDEWFEDTAVEQKVHPNGQVAAILTDSDRVRVIVQDPSGSFTLLDRTDESWSSITLPAAPKAGSPITTWVTEDGLRIFYVSADNNLHYMVEDDGEQWRDVAVETCVFDENSMPKRFMVTEDSKDGNNFQVFVMTESNIVWTFSQESAKLGRLGHMDGSKFVPDVSEQRLRRLTININCVIC